MIDDGYVHYYVIKTLSMIHEMIGFMMEFI